MNRCKRCLKPAPADSEFCPDCFTEIQAAKEDALTPSKDMESGSDSLSGIAKNVMSRYSDAYIVARATIGIGGVVKAVAICVAVIVVLVGLAVSLGGFADSRDARSLALILGGILVAVIFGTPIYVLGILVAAQGQTLQASLDSAVNSSTFLDNDQRAKVMSLV